MTCLPTSPTPYPQTFGKPHNKQLQQLLVNSTLLHEHMFSYLSLGSLPTLSNWCCICYVKHRTTQQQQKPDHLHPLVLRPPGLGVWSGENVQLLGPVGSLHIIKGSSTSLLHSLRLLLYIIRAIDTLLEEICNTERYNKERCNTERFNQERCNEERCWHFLGIREPAVLIQCIDVQFTVFGCIQLSFVFLL